MTVLFVLSLALLGFVMKLAAMFSGCERRGPCPGLKFVLSPLLAPNSLSRCQPLTETFAALRRGVLFIACFLAAHLVCRQVVSALDLRGPIVSYLAMPTVLFLGDALVPLATLAWLPAGYVLPLVHDNPIVARSLAEFWGRRWNFWFSDWFRWVIFDRMRSRPVMAILIVFAVSGLMHEAIINLTLVILTGHNLIGSMMIYFLVQGIGVLIEHRFLKAKATARRIFLWSVVVGPVPLIINEGLLRALWLWPG